MKSFSFTKAQEPRTFVGNIDFKEGDYLVIPRGMIYKMRFDTNENRHFVVESYNPVYTPKDIEITLVNFLSIPLLRKRFKVSEELETHDEKGEFIMKIKRTYDP